MERCEPGEVEIGWTFLARRLWGGRFNGAMKRLMLDHAFRFVDTVIFRIGETNLRSRRAVEKIGGRLIVGAPLATGNMPRAVRATVSCPLLRMRIISVAFGGFSGASSSEASSLNCL